MSVPWIALLLAAGTAAVAQGPPFGSEPPKLRGETLDGQPIVLPDAAAGKVTLLVLGASKKGGDRTGTWREHFQADFGSDPRVDYFTAALLENAPAVFRGMIKAGMRSGTPLAARSHVVICTSDEAAWKKYLGLADDALPGVLLLDSSGHVRWSYDGVFEPGRYSALKAATNDLVKQGGVTSR
jgi:hypothetical protein